MTIRVLITDANVIVRECLRRIIDASPDMRVVGEAAVGHEVLKTIEMCNPDVVLLDLAMPGMNSTELISRLLVEQPDLPMLALATEMEAQFALRALSAGVAGYLAKACTTEKLFLAIHQVVATGRYISPMMAEAVAEAMAATLFPDPMKMPHKRLSNRELQIFLLLASGKSINVIADELALSANTVSTHKRRLMLKLGAENNASLVRYAVMHELVT